MTDPETANTPEVEDEAPEETEDEIIVHVTLAVDVENVTKGTNEHREVTREHALRPHGLVMTIHQIEVIAERIADGYFTDESRVN